MAYQAIVDFLRDTAEAVNEDGTFIHGRKIDGSIEYNEPFPQIHLYPFTSTIDTSGGLVETANIVMGFWFQDAPDSSNAERESIIASADQLCQAFIQEIVEADGFDISGIRTEPQYQTIHGTLSGYALTFQLKTAANPC